MFFFTRRNSNRVFTDQVRPIGTLDGGWGCVLKSMEKHRVFCYTISIVLKRSDRCNIFDFFMKKDGIVEAVMKVADIETKKQATQAVDAVFDTIVKTLGRGEEVAITGFGTFRIAKRAARMGVNPKTGEKIQIAASTKPKFRAGKLLKEAVL